MEQIGNCQLHLGNCLTLLPELPSKSIDLIWTDPPYGLGNQQDDLQAARVRDNVKGARKAAAQPIRNDTGDDFAELIEQILKQSARLLKPTSAMAICSMGGGGTDTVFARMALLIEEYLQFFHALVWDKSARGNGMGWRYRRNYEFVYIAHRKGGKLAWSDPSRAVPNLLRHSPVQERRHPNEKPVALIEDMLDWHGSPGMTVLDPCMGSGSTAVAAVNMGMPFIGMELDPEHYRVAVERTRQAYRDRKLFSLIETRQPELFTV